jgi:hypothetical protein
MVSYSQRNKGFYTQKGIDALISRLKTLVRLFNENKFPFKNIMFGFGELRILNRQECLDRISELVDLTGFQLKIDTDKMEIIYDDN